MGYLLGLDIGSSSIKAALLDPSSGECVGSASAPAQEMTIEAPCPGFAEQAPALWKENAIAAIAQAKRCAGAESADIDAVGIAYQMHGLVCLDAEQAVLRPAIIWCDSRAVGYGEAACEAIGRERCLEHLLNSPGNFTAAKLAWVKECEPEIYSHIDKIMLPGDWMAFELTGESTTTATGLSEAILWDFKQNGIADMVLDHFGFDRDLIPPRVPSFGNQGEVTPLAAKQFGVKPGIPVTYRGGDQPNNAFSLNVLEPGEIAATAGTSGVVYGVGGQAEHDPQSRFNTFLHVNSEADALRVGHLLCINGTGIMNSWLRRMLNGVEYSEMNKLAETASVGSDGVTVLPFGNGAERMLGNRTPGAAILDLDLNRHGRAELCRAVQEGVAFSFKYGMDIMSAAGIDLTTIRAGQANMFLSNIFSDTLSGLTGAMIELYNTDGALGAARGAGVGSGVYSTFAEAFTTLKRQDLIEPKENGYLEAYAKWKTKLEKAMEDDR